MTTMNIFNEICLRQVVNNNKDNTKKIITKITTTKMTMTKKNICYEICLRQVSNNNKDNNNKDYNNKENNKKENNNKDNNDKDGYLLRDIFGPSEQQ